MPKGTVPHGQRTHRKSMEIAILQQTQQTILWSRPSVQGRVSGCALLRSVFQDWTLCDHKIPVWYQSDTSLIPVWYQLTRYQWYLYQWIPRVCIETALALGLSSGTTWVSGASWLCSAAGFSVGWDWVARRNHGARWAARWAASDCPIFGSSPWSSGECDAAEKIRKHVWNDLKCV